MDIKKIHPLIEKIKSLEVRKIDYSYEKTISHSQFMVYQKCNHRWELDYKNGLQTYSPSIAAIFGTAMHNTLQHYVEKMFIHSTEADQVDTDRFFQEEFIKAYQEGMNSNGGKNFSTASEMHEYYEDGMEIIKYFISERKNIIPTKDWYLVGIELPVVQHIHPKFKNVYLKGYLDITLYNPILNKIKILDFKTSKAGWSSEKKDEDKVSQLILYKIAFSQQYDFPIENIDLEYIILKRKLYKDVQFIQKRIQSFLPKHGKNKTGKVLNNIQNFIENIFNTDNSYQEKKYNKTTDSSNCKYCPYKNHELCGGINKK